MQAHKTENFGAPATRACPAARATGTARCGHVALLALFAFIIMPFGNALRSWDAVWVTAYDVGLGLALVGGLAAPGWDKRLPTVPRVAELLVLAGSSAWLAAARLGWLAVGTASPAGKALAILMLAAFTASCLCRLHALAPRAFPGSGPVVQLRGADRPASPQPGAQRPVVRWSTAYLALFLAAVAVTGAAWEEIWRSRVYASPLMAFGAFLVFASAALCLVPWRCGTAAGRAGCLAAGAATAATVLLEGFALGLVLGISILLFALGATVTGSDFPQSGTAPDIPCKARAALLRWAPLAGATGCCAGNWLVNAWGTLEPETGIAIHR